MGGSGGREFLACGTISVTASSGDRDAPASAMFLVLEQCRREGVERLYLRAVSALEKENNQSRWLITNSEPM